MTGTVPWRGLTAAGLAFLSGMFTDSLTDFDGRELVAAAAMALLFAALSANVLFTQGQKKAFTIEDERK